MSFAFPDTIELEDATLTRLDDFTPLENLSGPYPSALIYDACKFISENHEVNYYDDDFCDVDDSSVISGGLLVFNEGYSFGNLPDNLDYLECCTITAAGIADTGCVAFSVLDPSGEEAAWYRP